MKRNILLVEDVDAARENIAEELKMQGYGVTKANSGFKAVKIVKKQIPDLIICETYMEGMDGYSIYLALFKELDKNKIPFIYFTAKLKDQSKQKLKLLSIENFPFRRFHEKNLINCVKKIIPVAASQLNNALSMSYPAIV